jgi:hypothetical protein
VSEMLDFSHLDDMKEYANQKFSGTVEMTCDVRTYRRKFTIAKAGTTRTAHSWIAAQRVLYELTGFALDS